MEPAISVVMTGTCVGGIVPGTGCGWSLRARAFPLPPLQVMENFLSAIPRGSNKPDLSQSSSTRAVGKHCRTSHAKKGHNHRDRHMAPNLVRTFFRTRGIPEEIADSLPENLNLLKRRREHLKKNTVLMD